MGTQFAFNPLTGNFDLISGVATSSSSGTVTSYEPVIKSSVNTLTNAGYTITETDGYTMLLFSTGNTDRLLTFAAASACTGKRILIKKTDSGTGIVNFTAASGIDGFVASTSPYLYGLNDYMEVESNGTTWVVVSCYTVQSVNSTTDLGQANPVNGTLYDLAGTSITLLPGRYLLTASSPIFVVTAEANTAFLTRARLAITDSANTIIRSGAGTAVVYGNGANTSQGYGHAEITHVLTVATTTTYKLRAGAQLISGSMPSATLGTTTSSTDPNSLVAIRFV